MSTWFCSKKDWSTVDWRRGVGISRLDLFWSWSFQDCVEVSVRQKHLFSRLPLVSNVKGSETNSAVVRRVRLFPLGVQPLLHPINRQLCWIGWKSSPCDSGPLRGVLLCRAPQSRPESRSQTWTTRTGDIVPKRYNRHGISVAASIESS